jgi:hypothetical protein
MHNEIWRGSLQQPERLFWRQLPVLMLMLITLLNDGALISIGYDLVRPSPVSLRDACGTFFRDGFGDFRVGFDCRCRLAETRALEPSAALHGFQHAGGGGVRLIAAPPLGNLV